MENRMKNALKITALALCCVALVACSQKGPAEAALNAAQAAVDGVKTDAATYVPDQWKALMDSMAAARATFDKGEYKVALELAQPIPAKAKDVSAAAAAKKDELTKQWASLADVPGMVEQVKAKVNALAGMKKLPKGMDKAQVEAAQAGVAEATKGMADASEAYKAGNLPDAIAKGNAVKTKVTALMSALGLTPAAPAAPAAAAAAAAAAK
jgi:predicted small lipoprotein YifL